MEAENIVFGSSQGTLAAISSPSQLSLWIPSTKNIEDLTHFNHPKGYETPQKSGSWDVLGASQPRSPSFTSWRLRTCLVSRPWRPAFSMWSRLVCTRVRTSSTWPWPLCGHPGEAPCAMGHLGNQHFQGKQMRNVRKKTWRDTTTRQVDCEVWCSKSNVEQYRRDPGKYWKNEIPCRVCWCLHLTRDRFTAGPCKLLGALILGDDMICKQIGFCWEFWFKLSAVLFIPKGCESTLPDLALGIVRTG